MCEASIIHAAVHMSRAHRQAQQHGRAQIKQCIRGHCPQCTWRNTPQLISQLFLDKQRTRLPESCMILLQSHELLEQSLSVFHVIPLLLLFVPEGSIVSCFISSQFHSLDRLSWPLCFKSVSAGSQRVCRNSAGGSSPQQPEVNGWLMVMVIQFNFINCRLFYFSQASISQSLFQFYYQRIQVSKACSQTCCSQSLNLTIFQSSSIRVMSERFK